MLAHPMLWTPRWTPERLPNLVLWLQANKVPLAIGSTLTSWPDQGPFGHNGTAVGTPSLQLAGGQPVVRFNGTTDGFVCSSITDADIAEAGDVTMIGVCTQDDAVGATEFNLVYLGNGSENIPNFHFVGLNISTGADANKMLFNTYDGTERRAIANATITLDTFNSWIGLRSASVNSIYKDGVLQTTTAASGTPDIAATQELHIGCRPDGVDTRTGFYDGDVKELIVCNAAIASRDILRLQKYFRREYRIGGP